MDVRIRRAVPEDAPAIAEVHIASWQAAYRGHLPDEYLDGLKGQFAQRRQMWSSGISNSRSDADQVWVAEADGKLCGFASIGPCRDEGQDESVGQVPAIYLEPGYWDKGIGRELFAVATRELADCGFRSAVLWVLDTNERARRFYEAAGWKVDGATRRENVWGVTCNEVRYRVEL